MKRPTASDHLLSERGIRRWWKTIGIPLLIPAQGKTTLRNQDICSPTALITELDRLAALGSNWAAAALGVILLYPDSNGNREIERAMALVRKPAADGDPYCLYVLGWAELFSGKQADFVKLLGRAAQSGFSAALLDLAGAFKSKDPNKSIAMMRRAESMGNVVAPTRRHHLWMSGRCGFVRRIAGLVGIAFSSVRLFVNVRSDPLSAKVFCIHDHFATTPIRRAMEGR
jgi:hypothetical protein